MFDLFAAERRPAHLSGRVAAVGGALHAHLPGPQLMARVEYIGHHYRGDRQDDVITCRRCRG